MEKLKLFITEQLKNGPETEVRDRLGQETFKSAFRTSDNTVLEMLKKNYADIAIIRNAVVYESLGQKDDPKSPKVLNASTGIQSGDKLIWPAELGNTIWDGCRSPRLYTPFPNTMRANVDSTKNVVPMMNKIEEPLNKACMNKVLDDFFANGENPEQGPAFYGDINPEEIPSGIVKWKTGEWKLGSDSIPGVTEYGIWVSSSLNSALDGYDEDIYTARKVWNFIRNFNR